MQYGKVNKPTVTKENISLYKVGCKKKYIYIRSYSDIVLNFAKKPTLCNTQFEAGIGYSVRF